MPANRDVGMSLFGTYRQTLTVRHIACLVSSTISVVPRYVLEVPRTARSRYFRGIRGITVHCGRQYFVAEAESGVILLVSTRAFQICNQNRKTKFCKSDQMQLVKGTRARLGIHRDTC